MNVDRPWLTDYSHGAPWTAELPPVPLYALLDAAVERYPDAVYLDFMGRPYSYRSIGTAVAKAARGFQILGVRKGVKVGLFLPNCPQYVIAYNAILKAGGTVVNFSPLYSVPELIAQVEDSETDIMVTLDVTALYPTIAEVLEKSRLRCLVVGSIAEVLPRGKALLYRLFKGKERSKVEPDLRHIRWDTLLKNDGAYKPVEIDPYTDIAVLQYTGGTTGTPKGAMLTHANLSVNAQQVACIGGSLVDLGKEVMLGALPFFHVFANTVVLNGTTAMGGKIVILPKFELKPALKAISDSKVTILPGVPTMYMKMLESPDLKDFDLTSIKVCISGGAPLPVELKKRFEQLSGSVVAEGYGLTESSGVVAVNPFQGLNKPGSIGLPLPGTDIIITDREDPTKILGPGETGELCVRGPQVMAGYWKRADASAEVLIDGRLRTGDVGYLDEQGYAFIVDRLKDMISVGGFKVFPRHVEEVVYQHPAVLEATVIGIPDDMLGQKVKAFVVLRDEDKGVIAAKDILAFLKPKLGKHEYPSALEIRDSLPKTMIGKLSKKELVAEEMAAYEARKGKVAA
jgi:long-chain acyl-CoA synthetase